MTSILDPFSLPSISLANRSQLPACSAIYFAIDARNRILYVGKAKRLASRWKNHHRFYTLKEMDKECPVQLYWQPWPEDNLAEAEKILIQQLHPLLNETKVETEPVIPSEIVLRDFLKTFSRRLIISGIKPKTQKTLVNVYLHYDWTDATARGTAAKIRDYIEVNSGKNTSLRFKRHRHGRFDLFSGMYFRPGSRDHKTAARQFRAYNNHWEFACNGVILHVLPIDNYRNYKQKTDAVKLAGIKCRAINQESLFMAQTRDLCSVSGLNQFTTDPVPLLWPGLKWAFYPS